MSQLGFRLDRCCTLYLHVDGQHRELPLSTSHLSWGPAGVLLLCPDTSSGPDGSTVWTVNTSSASAQQCTLNHALWPSVSRVCGSFQALASEESPEDCFISTLSGTASLSLDGIEVVCALILGFDVMEIGRGTITISGEQLKA